MLEQVEQKNPTLVNKQGHEDKERLVQITQELTEKPDEKQIKALLDALYSTRPFVVLNKAVRLPLGDLR